ncbi:hypothetical protein BH23CHL2_BH23CHL2_02570 [soil metagenome]
MAGQRCAQPGCRAWAMRREQFCVAHRKGGGELALEAVDAGAVEVAEDSAFTAGVLSGERERLVDRQVLALIAEAGGNRAIDTEVGALRLLLLRALDQESLTGDLAETTLTVVRLTDAIGRALKVRQVLEGGRSSALEESLYQVLRDLDLGGEEDDEEIPDYDEEGFARDLDQSDS